MGKFREFLKGQQTQVNEAVNIEELNASGIGYIVNKTLAMAAQVHVWHLLAKTGQKHQALGSFYDELETEVDGLAEKFLAIGGVIGSFDFTLNSNYDDVNITLTVRDYRDEVSAIIMFVKDNSDLQSMLDGLTDLQETIDQFVYRFKLD